MLLTRFTVIIIILLLLFIIIIVIIIIFHHLPYQFLQAYHITEAFPNALHLSVSLYCTPSLDREIIGDGPLGEVFMSVSVLVMAAGAADNHVRVTIG